MRQNAIQIPSDLTADQAYNIMLRNRCAYYAAQIARDHDLGAEKMLHAAFIAYRHFDRFGFEDSARKVAEEFGLTAVMILSMHDDCSSDDVTVVKSVETLPKTDPPKEGDSASD